MPAVATPAAPKVAAKPKVRNRKVERFVLDHLFDNPGSPIKSIVDPQTGKPVEALYIYDAQTEGLIVALDEPVRTGRRGRPAKQWKLSKATRDRIRRQRQRGAKVQAVPEQVAA